MTGRRIAVIGSGVSGMTAGYVLSRTDHVTLFEADGRLGGHADTHLVVPPSGPPAASTPASSSTTSAPIPLLTRLFAELGVATQPAEMSMSVRCAGCGLQYAGQRGLGGLAPGLRRGRGPLPADARRGTPLPPRRAPPAGRGPAGARQQPRDQTLGEFLATGGFSALLHGSLRPAAGRRGVVVPARDRAAAIRPGTCSPSWPTTACCRCPGRRPGGP